MSEYTEDNGGQVLTVGKGSYKTWKERKLE